MRCRHPYHAAIVKLGGKGVCILGVCKISVAGYASRSGTKKWRERICIPKKVLKTELGTQNFLPSEMALDTCYEVPDRRRDAGTRAAGPPAATIHHN